MSDPILQSNQSSAVVATVNASTVKNPWVYDEKDRLTVPHSMQLLPIPRQSGSFQPRSECEFAVAKNGVAQGFWLRVEFTYPHAQELHFWTEFKFLDMIDQITLSTSGRVVETLDKFQIMARYHQLPVSRKVSMYQRSPVDRSTSEKEYHIWLPFYMFRDPMRYGILTNFEEPHHVTVKWSDLICSRTKHLDTNANEVTDPLTVTDAQLLVHYRLLDEPQLNHIVSKNYGDGMLSRLVGIAKRETVKRVAADDEIVTTELTIPAAIMAARQSFTRKHTVSIDLKESEAIRAMYVMVVTNDPEPYYENARSTCKIDHVKLTFNNTDVIDASGDFLRQFGTDWDMMRGQDISLDVGMTHNIIRIDLGHGSDATMKNVVAMRELSNPTLTVTFSKQLPKKPVIYTDANNNPTNINVQPYEHEVHVMYETAAFLSCSANTGRVQLSAST